MHRTVVAALVAALALGFAGCGSHEQIETVSRAQLARRLVTVCRASERAARSEIRGRLTRLKIALGQRRMLRQIGDEIDRLDATGGTKADLDTYKRTVRTRLAALERIATADSAEQPRVMTAELPGINRAGLRAHDVLLRVSEQLRLICF